MASEDGNKWAVESVVGDRSARAAATHVFQSARAWRRVMHCPIEAQAREGWKEGGREGERERGRATHATFTHARSHKWKNLCQRSSFWTLADDARGPAAITMTDRPTIGRERKTWAVAGSESERGRQRAGEEWMSEAEAASKK